MASFTPTMETGTIALSGNPFDLQSTLESGQSYLWWREDGEDFRESRIYGSDAWYLTTARVSGEPAVLRVRQVDDRIEWEATIDVERLLRHRLRLDDDLVSIREQVPGEQPIDAAFDEYWGMHLVREPPFGTLVSFICSAQMRVDRIHAMQQALREAYGEPITFDGRTVYTYPTPERLAAASESELRGLSLGYRAPYVRKTAELVTEGLDPADVRGLPYEDARKELTQFVGVGEKVADCVLLFSLGYLEAVPLDTWIRKTIATYYPDCDRGGYADTSAAIRAVLGGEFAGYTQTYLFHYLRHTDSPPPGRSDSSGTSD